MATIQDYQKLLKLIFAGKVNEQEVGAYFCEKPRFGSRISKQRPAD